MDELKAEVLVNRMLLLTVLVMLCDAQWAKVMFFGCQVLVFIEVVLESRR